MALGHVLAVAALAFAGCAVPGTPSAGTSSAAREPAPEQAPVPLFVADGSVARDPETEAPVYLCRGALAPAGCPRWNADGTVVRDESTGAPVFEERADGRVVRVLLVVP